MKEEIKEKLLLGVFVVIFGLLAALTIWTWGVSFFGPWIEQHLGFWAEKFFGIKADYLVTFWPITISVLVAIPPFLCWAIFQLWRFNRASKEAAAAKEKAQADALAAAAAAAALARSMQQNAERVREKMLEVEMAYQTAFDDELASNIASARQAYPSLMETVKDEEAFLKEISFRHPNISGFVATRTVGDSKNSAVAKLGRFLDGQ